MARTAKKNNDNGGANLGFEAKLWVYGPPLKDNAKLSAAQIMRRLGVV